MKICMLLSTPFPPTEGIGYHTYYLSKKLIEKGHEVVIITRGSWKKTQRLIFDGIEVIKVPFIPLYPFYIRLHGIFVNKIFKSLESQVDVLHIHTPLPPLIKTSLPIVTTIHTPMLIDYRLTRLNSIYSLFSKISAKIVSYPQEKKLIQASNIVTTVSDTVAQELQEYNINPDKVIVAGNGVDEEFFCYKQKESNDGHKYIMFVGRIDREKGLFDLVECAKHICRNRSDVFFTVAGKGRDLKKLIRKAKKAGVQNRFVFLGQVEKDHLVKLYQNAAIFVLPSYHEGLPGVLLEAMSCGLPIITTDVRGNRDLISNGKNGIIVPPRNPEKLAEAILTLLNNDRLGATHGEHARKTIEEKYTWDKITNKFLRCYKSLVEV
jgi:glycosyltransferase involved in cell wall biosynthesis